MCEWLICICLCFFFQAEDGIRDLVRSRGLGDVYKRQGVDDGLVLRCQQAAGGIDHPPARAREPGGGFEDGRLLDLSLIHI